MVNVSCQIALSQSWLIEDILSCLGSGHLSCQSSAGQLFIVKPLGIGHCLVRRSLKYAVLCEEVHEKDGHTNLGSIVPVCGFFESEPTSGKKWTCANLIKVADILKISEVKA